MRSGAFEVKNNDGKISINEEVPCVYLLEKRTIGSADKVHHINEQEHHLTFRDINGLVYFNGFDLNQLPNGSSCIDTHETNGSHSFAYAKVYGDYSDYERVKNVEMYFFGIKKRTDDSNVGLEVYDSYDYVLFTSRQGTKYPKVLQASSADSVSFSITTNPAIFSVIGWDVIPHTRQSQRRVPRITKNGSSITVNKSSEGLNWGPSRYSLLLYNWMLLSLQTIE